MRIGQAGELLQRRFDVFLPMNSPKATGLAWIGNLGAEQARPVEVQERVERLSAELVELLGPRMAATSFTYSVPPSEWKPRIRKGNCSSMACSTGSMFSRQCRRGGHYFPLRDAIDGVDVVHAAVAAIVPLVHAVDADEAGPVLGDWCAPNCDGVGLAIAARSVRGSDH